MIRLLLVDDQIIVRQGLKSLLESKPDLLVVGDAENAQNAVELVEALYGTPQQQNVVLMDVQLYLPLLFYLDLKLKIADL